MNKNKIIGLAFLTMLSFVLVNVTAAPVWADETEKVTIGFDLGHNGYHVRHLGSIFSTLEEWGYAYENLTEFTATSLEHIDILITFPPDRSNESYAFTDSELSALKTWFDEGNKAVWATADSDFGDTNGTTAAGINKLLEAIKSNVLVEQASVESTLNAGADYRVRPSTFNTNDTYVTENFYGELKLTSTYMHGPAPLIGVNEAGKYIKLENNATFWDTFNAKWIAKATNNGTYSSLLVYHAVEGLKYQVHDSNEQSDFVMMTAQRFMGAAETSKIVVSAEAIMTDYKNMFNTTDEYGNPSINKGLVKNTLAWMAKLEKKSGGGVPGFEALVALVGIFALIPVLRRRK